MFTIINKKNENTKLNYLHFIKEIWTEIRDDSKNKIEQNYPLHGNHRIQIMKLKWLTLEFVKFS